MASFVFNPRKHRLQKNQHIMYKGMEYIIVEQVTKTKYILVYVEDYSYFKSKVLESCHSGRPYKYVKWLKKDYRELKGCEVF